MMAQLALTAMLFAQGALAFAACDWVRRAPAHAIAQESQPVDDASCHEQKRNVNLCVAHCLGEDQSLDKHTTPIPALAAAPVLTLREVLLAPQRLARSSDRIDPAIGPPPHIRFRSLIL